MLKAANGDIHQHMLEGMNKILMPGAEVPKEWRKARIVLIPKDGSPTNPANYRPISLLQTSYKIFTKIITNRLSSVANQFILTNSQLGFCTGMSAQSALRVMVDIIEDSNRHNSELQVAFIDFKKVFDSVHHKALLESLDYYGLGARLIDLISRLYNNCKSDMFLNHSTSSTFPINRGVRQGDTLSPLLFILILNPLLKWIKRGESGHQFPNGLTILVVVIVTMSL